jgi:hypothetical protein
VSEAFSIGRVHALSRLEAAERGRLLDRFWDRVTEGRPGSPVVDLAARAGDHAWRIDALRHHRDRPGVPT